MINAFLFPGQGSQSVGMGKQLYDEYPEAENLLDKAVDILGYDLKKLMFEGPIEELTDTKYAQTAIFACSAMHLEKAKKLDMTYEYVAGHSLGEYSALYAAGVFDFEEGLRLVNKRAKAMAEENGKGTMAAVIGLTEEELKLFIDPKDGVVMANLNTKNQIVISGEEKGIEEIELRLKEREDVSVKRLKVSAAFHSPGMQKAADVIKKEIECCAFREPQAFVVSNVTGKPTKDVDEIRTNLIKQVTGQVRWYDSVIAMKNAGVEAFYECGNGVVLSRMNKAITLRPKCTGI